MSLSLRPSPLTETTEHVDLKSGTAGYSTPTLLSIGTGSDPYKLDYSLSYKAAPTGCNAFGPCTNVSLR